MAPKDSGEKPIPGLMHLELRGYHIGDVECVAAFDVAKGKVGRDLAEAIEHRLREMTEMID